MFSVQINAISTQIQALTEKKNQYCTLEKQVESVKEALNQIEQTAQGLEPDTMPQVFTALGLPVATITDVQTPQQAQQLEQLKQQSHQLEQAKEQSQQAQAQVVVQQEEIASLKQKLLAAERFAQASKEQQEAIERHVISEKEMLEEQKIAYVEHMKDLEDTAAQFVFPSDIENFIRSGKFEFDLVSDLEQVVEYLDKTPDWCVKARVKRLWSMACTVVRERLSEHLPPHLIWIWKECAVTLTQTASQSENQLEQESTQLGQVSSEQLPNQQLETSREVFDAKVSDLSNQVSSQEVYNDVFGEQEPTTWVNLVDYEDEEEYNLGLDEELEDDWQTPVQERKGQPELEIGDSVQIASGEICTIENIEYIGIMVYFTLKLPNGRTQSGFRACDFQRVGTGIEEQFVQTLLGSTQPLAPQAPKVEEVTGELTEVPSPNSQAALRIGLTVKVPGGRIGQVTCFSTNIMGQELVAVEFTTPKRKKKSTEQFPVSKVTVLEGEAENIIALPENENIGRLCDCPDGRTGRIVKTTKKGRFLEAQVSFDDGTTKEYDLNSLWLLPEKVAGSQAA